MSAPLLGATAESDETAQRAAAMALAAAALRAGAAGPDDDAGLLNALQALGLLPSKDDAGAR